MTTLGSLRATLAAVGRLPGDRPVQRALAVIVALASLTGLSLLVLQRFSPGDLVGLALGAGGFALGQRRPGLGVAVAALAPIVAAASGGSPMLVWTITVFAAVSVTLRGLGPVLVGVGVGAANYAAFLIADRSGWADPQALLGAAVPIAGAAVGAALSGRSALQAERDRRRLDVQATREAEVRRRIAEERLRIARDLHDTVGHQLAVVSMHLGAAEVHLGPGEDAARADLAGARVGVKTVLGETQRLLALLRTDPEDDALAPPPAYEHLGDLVASYQHAGLSVDARLAPAPTGLDPEVGAAAYRVVEEALTNAQRHGAGGASLATETVGGRLVLTVENPTRDADADAQPGYGLVGMRERVASAGGSLSVEPGRTYRVRAVFPLAGGQP